MILNTDGGARGNPGPGAAGAVLKDDAGNVIKEVGKYLGVSTNNEAEYQALILGLTLATELKVHELICKLDSELVVNQLNGFYKVKNEKLGVLFKTVKNLQKNFSSIKFVHIPRTQNKEADALVNATLDTAS